MDLPESTSEERITRLENKLRRQTLLVRIFGILLIAAMLAGAARGVTDEIRSRRFVICDENNRPRGYVASYKGSTVLALLDNLGTTRTRLAVPGSGHPHLTLFDVRGEETIRLAEDDGAAVVTLSGRDGDRLLLGQAETGFGVDLESRNTATGVQLRVGSSEPQLAIVGPKDAGIVQIFSKTTQAGISVSDSTSQPAAVLTVVPNQDPVLLLSGRQGRKVISPASQLR